MPDHFSSEEISGKLIRNYDIFFQFIDTNTSIHITDGDKTQSSTPPHSPRRVSGEATSSMVLAHTLSGTTCATHPILVAQDTMVRVITEDREMKVTY